MPAALVLLALLWQGSAPAAESHGSAALPTSADINLPYPEQMDIVQEASGWTYRLNDNEALLYMSTADAPGKSSCNDVCAKQWIPVAPNGTAKPVGEWTIISRKDGSRQWAFKDHAVYTRVTDKSGKPMAVPKSSTFHLMPHFK